MCCREGDRRGVTGVERTAGEGSGDGLDRPTGDCEVDGTVQTSPQSERPQRRTQSLRREYEEFILQRIEEYKEQLSRPELLSLGDEAVRELDAGPQGQLVLTEVLMLDHVDRIIKLRLRLPTFRRWRERHLKLRQAQRAPTHWGLPTDTPLADLARRLEHEELALVVGVRAAPAGFLIAAHNANVLLIDQDIAGIETNESRAATEALGHNFQALVISLAGWFPDVNPNLVVIDPLLIASLDDATASTLVELLKSQTAPSGVHLVLPTVVEEDPIPKEVWYRHYAGWEVDSSTRVGRPNWILATQRRSDVAP